MHERQRREAEQLKSRWEQTKRELERQKAELERRLRELESKDQFLAKLSQQNAKTGAITCSLMWDMQIDLDLHCRAPDGSHIYHGSKKGNRGGELDVDNTSGGRGTVENVFFYEPAPSGTYKFWVHNYSDSTRSNTFQVRLRLADDETRKSFGSLGPKQEATAFEIQWDGERQAPTSRVDTAQHDRNMSQIRDLRQQIRKINDRLRQGY